jgi:hypothetical protein
MGFQRLTGRDEKKLESKAKARPRKKSQRKPTNMQATPAVRNAE